MLALKMSCKNIICLTIQCLLKHCRWNVWVFSQNFACQFIVSCGLILEQLKKSATKLFGAILKYVNIAHSGEQCGIVEGSMNIWKLIIFINTVLLCGYWLVLSQKKLCVHSLEREVKGLYVCVCICGEGHMCFCMLGELNKHTL